MSEQAALGTLGFVFVALGVVAIAFALGGLLAAGGAFIVVGIALGVMSTL